MKLSKYNLEIETSSNLILFNSLKNAYAIFDKGDYKIFKENPAEYLKNECDDKKMNALLDGGFLIHTEEKEWMEVMDKFHSIAFNSSMFTSIIIPTDSCNLACPYCFAPRSSLKMTESIVLKVKEYFINLFNERGVYFKYFNIKWFGGEPLICPDIIKDISETLINLCDQAGIIYSSSIYTNLTLLNDDICEMFKRCRIDTVFTTLDGFGKENDERRPDKSGKEYFDKVINNIVRIKPFTNVHILVNIDKKNQNNVYKLIDYLVEEKIVDGKRVRMGFNLINDNDYIEDKSILMNYSDKETNELFEKMIKRLGNSAVMELPDSEINCFALARNSLVITPEGNLKKCPLGSAYGTLDKAINSEDIDPEDEFFFYKKNPLKREHCVNCNVFPICFGGCSNDDMDVCTVKHLLESKIRRYFEGR